MENNSLTEEWRTVGGFEKLYEVSNFGRVRSLPRNTTSGKILKLTKCRGYEYAHLHKNGKSSYPRVHRLVAEAFIPNPGNKPQVNHINGNCYDNRPLNLEWCTCSENHAHRFLVLGHHGSGRRKKSRVRCCETGKEYDSVMLAANGDNNLAAKISNAARQYSGHKTANGLHWEYVL